MLESYFLRGILIGVIFGVPAGAIGALTIQRTLSHGFSAGFVTGLGCTMADLAYACVGLLGITLVSDFLKAYETAIALFGGIFILFLGLAIVRKKTVVTTSSPSGGDLSRFFATSLCMAVANPATIMAFFLAFSSFGIGQGCSSLQCGQLLLGLFVGTCGWWGFLSGAVAFFRRHVTPRIYQRLNQALGTLMALFGVAMVVRIFYT